MKKLFTFALLALVALTANAETKKWDFTSWSTAANILVASDWTKSESASKNYIEGDQIRWNLNASQLDANGYVTANGAVIPELQGVKFTNLPEYGLAIAFDYGTTLDANAWGPYNGPSYLWFTGANTTFTIPNVFAGSTVSIGVESHKPGDSRGFTLAAGDNSSVLKSADYAVLTYTVPGTSGTVDVTFTPTKGCHLYFIEADVNATPVDPSVDPQPTPTTPLGEATWSIKDGSKVSPFKNIILSFPNADATKFTSTDEMEVSGQLVSEAGDEIPFDGLGGDFLSGVIIPLEDLEVAENTSYVLTVNSVLVNGEEYAPEGGFALNFTTRSAERKLSWVFTIDEESSTKIVEDVQGDQKYWHPLDAENYTRTYAAARNYEPLMLDDNTELPMAEQLLFKCGDDKIYVGNANNPTKDYDKAIVFNANDIYVVIPDCKAGDLVKFHAKYATKPSSSKRPYIMGMNGGALANDGVVSSTGLVDSVDVSNNYADYKFTVQVDGDVTFALSQLWLQTIDITEARPIVDCNYSVVATCTEEDVTKTVKTIVPAAVGKTNETISVPYSYWIADEEGNAYTHGAKGSEFVEMFDLQSDTTFAISYKKLNIEGLVKVVYLEEAENIDGAIECTSSNAAVRSSNRKAASIENDVTLTTLEPGDYRIKVVVFDAGKTASRLEAFAVGDQAIEFTASATNFSEQESETFTVTEATPVIWKASSVSETAGLDIVMIYTFDEEAGIQNVTTAKNATKAMYNLVGVQVNDTYKGIVIKNGKKFVK